MRAGCKIEQRMDVGERLHIDRLPLCRRSGRRHDAFLKADLTRRLDGSDRTEQRDQRRQIIRPHVEDGTGAGAEKEAGVGVPMLHAVRHHRSEPRQRLADCARVDERARFLDPGASTVSGAAPTRSPFARAAAIIASPSATAVAIGFSE